MKENTIEERAFQRVYNSLFGIERAAIDVKIYNTRRQALEEIEKKLEEETFIQQSDKRFEPALREFYWLIEQGKISEDDFVKDILHRLELIKNSELRAFGEEVKKWLKRLNTKNINPREIWKDEEAYYDGYFDAVSEFISKLDELIKV